MKKIYTISFILFISISGIMAQATPNAGFEAWTYGSGSTPYQTPDNWNTLNSTTAQFGVITCERESNPPDTYSGLASIKLITKSVLGQTTNGLATTGTIVLSPPSITGGIAYTSRPDSIVGFYKYTSVSADNGFAEIQLLGAGGDTDTVGYARFKTPAVSVGGYTRFAKAITYKKTNAVVTSKWVLSSSADATTHFVNSTLWIDNLQLVLNPSNVVEQQSLELSVGPNPTSSTIIIKNPMLSKASISVYDVTGRKVLTQSVFNLVNTLDITAFPEGMYIYSIIDENSTILKTNKLIFRK